jgi:hypothetical protein
MKGSQCASPPLLGCPVKQQAAVSPTCAPCHLAWALPALCTPQGRDHSQLLTKAWERAVSGPGPHSKSQSGWPCDLSMGLAVTLHNGRMAKTGVTNSV